MGKFLIILITSASLIACQPAIEEQHTLQVNGTGSITVVPDQIRLSMTVHRNGESLVTLKQQVDAITLTIIEQLQATNIAAEDISSYRLYANPQYQYDNGKRTQTGYEVSREIQVTLRTPEYYDELIEHALAAGVTNISSPSYEFSQTSKAYQDALALAVSDAHRKAQTLATAAQVSLQDVATVIEQSSAPVIAVKGEMMMSESRMVSQPGSSQITAHVSVTYIVN